jgi:tRNA (uracil-5-)-methyltransferase
MSEAIETAAMPNTRPEIGQRFDGNHLVSCPEGDYDTLLQAKLDTFHGLMAFTGFDRDKVDVFESPKSHFRMRANFTIWRESRYNNDPKGMYYVMFDMSNINPETQRPLKKPCEITNFPRGSLLINKMMEKLMEVCRDEKGEHPEMSKVLRENLIEVRFVTTQIQQAIAVLIYRQPLDESWSEEALKAVTIFQDLLGEGTTVKIIGRSKKVKIVVPHTEGVIDDAVQEAIEERYTVKGKQYTNYQTEGAFSQPNATVCEKMLTWSSDVTEGSSDKDCLELYCGGGTFTSVLATNFKRVLATEISKPSVKLANKAFADDGIENIKIGALAAEDFSAAFKEKRNLRVLAAVGIRITDYDIDTVLVDPPRAGLDTNTCELLCQFRAIVYISCNPETLARDVQIMSKTHEVRRMAAFDQFPYTHHLEGGVYLVRKEAGGVDGEADDASGPKRVKVE